mmetsp:Transcript_66805/g.134148  ORF Transcript_66805/g.134148 Transcript_66805/m.134148 type:complete len:114 (+) Transcript_66805:64-405(+)
MQDYVDRYKKTIELNKMKKNLLFAEGVSGVLMNEYPLDSACATSWRSKMEVMNWYDDGRYQQELIPVRREYSRCLTLLIPIFEDRIDDLQKARTSLVVTEKLENLLRAQVKQH